ncbi:glycosyltransferase family 2 protein [Desulforhabdus amnigena]|uniref:Glycosyl transferase family 2 n=1 Tax=Desulforhabdus amnigena TaxID=40218 RepID=A0A9W6D0A8_9BACT|nr:glycosyltransferase family 2 protein [Desulforhabdus amnigena]GLI32634.1 glycosyl transferase family 2 [Desulforhabdus amnigena]
MKVSLIITTYNWVEALRLSILSAFRQTEHPWEIIIADDGSGAETSEAVRDLAGRAPMPLLHVWQSDRGFRAAKIRNKAISEAKGEYVILIDGDMILHEDFVKDHMIMAKPGHFSQGSRVLLTREKTAEVLRTEQFDFSPFEPGLLNRKNALRSQLFSKWFSRDKRELRGIRTCNFSFWRSDALAVNGFNEDFEGWGREDSEFAARLLNYGIRKQNIRFSALAYHLFHAHRSLSALSANQRILDETVRKKISRCTNGMDKYLFKGKS